ncbi:MAG: ribosomal-protein-alanine N-acetyltransferase [Thermoprotei archaeon]|nr:MAG: ribosomal-protein-alanine N-acetyltransferase [Thermoprotei archaeon]
MVIIKYAELKDMPHVCKAEQECFKYPYPPQVLLMLKLLYPELFLIAAEGDEIVGYACGVMRSNGCGHIVSICVRPKYRRRGIGKALMIELENRLKDLGARCFVLEVRVSNTVAQKLYIDLGYRIVKRIENYYPDGEDAYIMRKDL